MREIDVELDQIVGYHAFPSAKFESLFVRFVITNLPPGLLSRRHAPTKLTSTRRSGSSPRHVLSLESLRRPQIRGITEWVPEDLEHVAERRQRADAAIAVRSSAGATELTGAVSLSQRAWNAVDIVRRVRMDVESIGEPHKKIEERTIVDRFSDLGIAPTDVSQSLDLLVGDAIRVSS